jgi:hypothetical protein
MCISKLRAWPPTFGDSEKVINHASKSILEVEAWCSHNRKALKVPRKALPRFPRKALPRFPRKAPRFQRFPRKASHGHTIRRW